MNVDQAEFSAAVLGPELATPTGLTDPSGRPAGKRFDVYRNNVVVSLIDAMETAFPVIRKLLGSEFFRAMVKTFVRAHPPNNPVLMFYGTEFPRFLENFEPVAKYPYLPDMAHLELARRTSYHAKDVTAIDARELSDIGTEHLMQADFQLAPCIQIVPSPYPIVALWEFNMTKGKPKPVPEAQTALITRPAFDLEMQKIDFGTRVFLQALQSKSTLSQAFGAALADDLKFDLSKALSLMLQREMIIRIELQKQVV